MVLGILGYSVFKNLDARAGLPSGDNPGWYWVSWDTWYSRIGAFGQAYHHRTSQDGTGYPGILSIQGLACWGRLAARGQPRMVLGTWYSRIGVFGQACHQGTSQDDTRYPGILSIQGSGYSGRPAIRGHPRIVLGILRYVLSIRGLGYYGRPAIRGHPRMVLGILGYLVFKDWGALVKLPSGLGCSGAFQDNTGDPGILWKFSVYVG